MTTGKPCLKKILLSILKWSGCVLAALLVVFLVVLAAARATTYFSHRIQTENGIDESLYVTLGGQEQYLLIRGEDVSNPVVIWLHGGPSDSDAYLTHTFQKYLVQDYTVVNWDQRGCGRTYYRNREQDGDNRTATFAQAQADLGELIAYVCDRFEKDKVILIGYSYGTMLGSKYTLDHPQQVAAYIGVGQVVSPEGEIYNYLDALQKAKANGDDTADMEAAYEAYLADASLMNMMILRSKTDRYHVAEKQANTLWLRFASPYMGFDDFRWFLKQTGNLEDYFALNRQLYEYATETDVRDYGSEYRVPVGFISGLHDWVSPAAYTYEYFCSISAPQKQIHLIPDCGHAPQYDSPEEFCDILKGILAQFLS